MDKQKVITGVVISLVAIVVIALLYMLANGPSCALVKDKPTVQIADIKPIASADFKNLARFAGNLEYRFDDKEKKDETFLGLNLASVVYGDKSHDELSLNADCATVELDTSTEKGVVTVNNIVVDLKVANGDHTMCMINNPGITFTANQHYKCEKEKAFACVSADPADKQKVLANLNINVLEFEIGGDPETHKKGSFVTSALLC